MTEPKLQFAISTYRLRDVRDRGGCDANFQRSGQTARIIVFDDSSVANHERYYGPWNPPRTQNELWYVARRKRSSSSHTRALAA